MRHIPATMATQHPDNANAPFWERDGDGFISAHEELDECMACFQTLGVREYMWDWEGKHADEAVIDKLFTRHYPFVKRNHIGRDVFLTFRIPNIWKEQGYSLMRALTVILTSEDFAQDLKFHSPPLFEVILPMTERAEQLLYIQRAFQKLAQFKAKTFNHRSTRNTEILEMIPLVEAVNDQLSVRDLLERFIALHKRTFKTIPRLIRPFLARSDPALTSGMLSNILANKIALSDIHECSTKHNIPMYPIIGVGGLPFRGGLNPDTIKPFLKEYGGVRTVTIQSAFRYDYPLSRVKSSIRYLNQHLPKTNVQQVDRQERNHLISAIRSSTKHYQHTLSNIIHDLTPFFNAVPKRRERRLHIGLLSYQRNVGALNLPRAISFTAALYSIGVPPEFIGLGRTLKHLTTHERAALERHYVNLEHDVRFAGGFVNRENIKKLAKTNSAWNDILDDIAFTEQVLSINLNPTTTAHSLHYNLTSNAFLLKRKPKQLGDLMIETGKLRKSLG